MRRFLSWLVLLFLLLPAGVDGATDTVRIRKVLPHLLDRKGRHAVSPSLYDRDAYQDHLRRHPEEVSALRFDIHWQARMERRQPLQLRLEVRTGRQPKPLVLERTVQPGRWYNSWSSLSLDGEAFRESGGVVAWRATLWQGEQLLAEQRSFLW